MIFQVGTEIARGGEGVIHEVPGRSDVVAKLYNTPQTIERAAKLQAMIAMAKENVPPNTAWPSDLIIGNDSAVWGFIMPRANKRHDLSTLLAGASRRATFPHADYRMLVATAANLARSIAAVHAAGHVVGDVNERFAMVAEDATIVLIDCDSFQIESDAGIYTCDVGIPMYQPPELLAAKTFRGQRRTRNHDAFGLAVLIFQILFFGRHPFAGRPLTGEAPELPDAIRAFQFAWGNGTGLARPPATLQLSDVGADLAAHFRQAFGSKGGTKERPRPDVWAALLDEFQAKLVRCDLNSSHWHLPRGHCSVCGIEQTTGLTFFVERTPTSINGSNPEHEANRIWSAIEAKPPPPLRLAEPLPGTFLPMVSPVSYPKSSERMWIGKLLQNFGLLESEATVERKLREDLLAEAQRHYKSVVKNWHAHDPRAEFNRRRAELLRAREQLTALFEERKRAIFALQNHLGRNGFLAGHEILHAGIKGFGRSRVATLLAHGVATAADVSPANLDVVPGIGPKRKAALIAWQNDLASRYRPSAAGMPLDASVVQDIDSRYHAKFTRLLLTLRSGVASLGAISDQERKQSAADMEELAMAAQAVAQAEVNLNAPTPP